MLFREKLADEGGNDLAVSAPGEAFCRNAHDLSHVLGACGSYLGDDFAQLRCEFFLAEGFGEVFLDYCHLCLLAFCEVGAVLLAEDCGSVLALLCELGKNLQRVGIGEFVAGTRGCMLTAV